jgi:ubiquinone/menaquinone biosynthesis C-methylase UbiE
MSTITEFNRTSEQAFWEGEPVHPITTGELDDLEEDMRLWVPGFPATFKGKRILDIGAGRGPLGTLVAQRYDPHLVVSADIVSYRLKTASPWLADLRSLNLICADVSGLPFKDESFDFVIANSSLHHLPRLDPAVKELVRVLRPGGFYIGREPNFNNRAVRTAVFKFDGTWIRHGARVSANEYPLRAEQIKGSFSAAGCRCDLKYFWRKMHLLHHPILSVAISVQAQRGA